MEAKEQRDWKSLFRREVLPEERELLDRMSEPIISLADDIYWYPFGGEYIRPDIEKGLINLLPMIKEWQEKFGKKIRLRREKLKEVV